MVKITHQPPLGPTTVNPAQRTHAVEPSEPVNKDSVSTPERETPFVERRKGDRRKHGASNRKGAYDMRTGRDRRKNSSGGSSIDVDA